MDAEPPGYKAPPAPAAAGQPTVPGRKKWLRIGWCATGLLLGCLIAFNLHRAGPEDPVYSGKHLSEWLYDSSFDFCWMPNDLYGHIHDELWEALVHEGPSQEESSFRDFHIDPPADPWQIDQRAIPALLAWMAAKPSAFDKVCDWAADFLPFKVRAIVYPYSGNGWSSRYKRWQIAACEGFQRLGTNAEAVLPALTRLLYTTEPDLPLTSAIAATGPTGLSVLTNALTSTNLVLQREAALELGMCGEGAAMAMPALVNCVERGFAGYHVLGAIGRIGTDHPRFVPALVHVFEENENTSNTNLDITMAALVLGLKGRQSTSAVPVLTRMYLKGREDGEQGQQKVLRRVIKRISPTAEAALPTPSERETNSNWP